MRPSPLSRRRGSALLLALIFTTVLAIILGSAAMYTVTEKRLNTRNVLTIQSRYAVESLLEHGFTQLHERFTTRTQMPALNLIDEPLVLPAAGFWERTTAGAMTGANAAPARMDNFQSADIFLMGSTLPPGQWTTLAGRIHQGSPLVNQRVWEREITLLARASIRDTNQGGRRVTIHAAQRFAVYDSPLFANAIFYNMDMEFAPGPNMAINGPVHSNRRIFVGGGSGTLTFQGGLTSAGEIFYGRLVPQNVLGNTLQSVQVVNRITSSLATWPSTLNLANPPASGALANPTVGAAWLANSSSLWGGGVQSASHGMLQQNLVGMRAYSPPVGATPAVNDAHDLIVPATTLTATSTATEREVENQKFVNRAGLRIVHQMTIASGVASHTITAFRPQRINAAMPLGRDALGNLTNVQRDAQGNILWQQVGLPSGVVTTPDNQSGTGNAAMLDHRRSRNLFTVDINVGALRTAVNTAAPGTAGGFPAAVGPVLGYVPALDWNGVVYVEAANLNNSGVRLVNGDSLPSRNADLGFTLATNNALYVKGNYNADGASGTGSSTLPDGYGTALASRNEQPAALVADAVTLLSPGFSESGSFSNANPSASTSFMEVSAAIIAGIVPPTASSYSGGVENFPRFLEDWSGRTLRYRGSMVALFQSEVATEIWGVSYYQPPTRDWGFNADFADGAYPPGTPVSRSFRRSLYRDLSAADFTAEYNRVRAALVTALTTAGRPLSAIPVPAAVGTP